MAKHMEGHHKATKQEQAARAAQHKRAETHKSGQFLYPPRKGSMPTGPNPLGVGIETTPGGGLKVKGPPLSKADQARARSRGGGSVFGGPNPYGVGISEADLNPKKK